MTVKRKRRMFIRIHVPTSLQDLLGIKEIVRTLKTESAAEAKLLDEDIHRQLPVLWRDVAFAADHNPHLPQQALQERIKRQIDALVETHIAQFAQARLKCYQRNPLQTDLLSQIAGLTAQISAQTPEPTPEAKKDSPLWSTVAGEWLAEKELSLKGSSIKDYRGYLPVMQEALGADKPIASITRAEFTEAIKRLATMKSTHGKPFSQRSVEKYSMGFSMVCNYAVKADHIGKNLCPPVTKKSKKASIGSDDEKWPPFKNDDEISDILALPGMNNSKKPHLRPIFLTGLLGGLRITEIVQLHLADLKTVDGVLCFDVNEVDDEGLKSVKSESSWRLVPVHPYLAPVLEEFTQQARNMGSERLFPGLKSSAVSKQLARLIDKVCKGPVFHSARKRFSKALADNGVDKNLTAALLGHKDNLSVTTIYTGKYPVKTLAAAVHAIDYPFL